MRVAFQAPRLSIRYLWVFFLFFSFFSFLLQRAIVVAALAHASNAALRKGGKSQEKHRVRLGEGKNWKYYLPAGTVIIPNSVFSTSA